MNKELLDILRRITPEEQEILSGKKISKDRYSSTGEFTIRGEKMLDKGSLINIRTHTRFIAFPKHRHDYIEIIYMCSGSTTHIINNDTKIVLEQGNLLFLNQFSYHEILPAGENDIAVNFIVRPEFFDVAFDMMEEENVLRKFIVSTLCNNTDEAAYLHFNVADILPIQNLVENMVWSLVNKQSNSRRINQTTMGLLFLQLMNYVDKLEEDGNEVDFGSENRISFATLKYVEENYKDASLAELAKILNMSIFSLSRHIKQATGYNFKELLRIKRFNKSVQLLVETTLPIADIIAAVGYDNTSYFFRVFKEKYGCSPKHYRDERCK